MRVRANEAWMNASAKRGRVAALRGRALLKGDKKGSLDPKVPNLISFYTAEF